MKKAPRHHTDIEDYISTFSDEERAQLAEAEESLDLAIQLYHARQESDLTQAEAGVKAGIKQQIANDISPIITDIRQLAMSDWPDDMTAEQVDTFIQELRLIDRKK